MRAGAARVDITPPVGFELSGFVAREQPSIGVHDRLSMRGLMLEQGPQRLLWINADLIAFDGWLADRIKAAIGSEVGLRPEQIVLSATHTHSGPPTITLSHCGAPREGHEQYLSGLVESAVRVAREASLEDVEVFVGEDTCGFSFDRRNKPSAHVDQRVTAIGFRRSSGRWLGVLANYGVHPVSMGHDNRLVSGDIHGMAASALNSRLEGNPTVLMTNGACGNVNPPRAGTDFEKCQELAAQLADAVQRALASSSAITPYLTSALTVLEIAPPELGEADRSPLEVVRRAETESMSPATRARAYQAIDEWIHLMRSEAALTPHRVPVQAVRIGPVRFACIGAEVFSIMGDLLRQDIHAPVVVVGYANGNIGYLAPDAAYEEGGYEVESAYIYYHTPPIPRGAFGKVRQTASELILSL